MLRISCLVLRPCLILTRGSCLGASGESPSPLMTSTGAKNMDINSPSTLLILLHLSSHGIVFSSPKDDSRPHRYVIPKNSGWLPLTPAVLFKFRPEVTDEQKETFVRELKTLKNLPCVLKSRLVVGGPSITDPIERSKGFHFALVSYHRDRAALEEYQASSEHHR